MIAFNGIETTIYYEGLHYNNKIRVSILPYEGSFLFVKEN